MSDPVALIVYVGLSAPSVLAVAAALFIE